MKSPSERVAEDRADEGDHPAPDAEQHQCHAADGATAPAHSESVDFRSQIADLTEEDRTFLSGVALEEFSEPTEKGVDQLLKSLEVGHLKGESAALYGVIKLREAEGGSEIDELIRMKQEKDRRIAKLKSRKGLTVGN